MATYVKYNTFADEISKDAKLIGSLGGRPRKSPYASV